MAANAENFRKAQIIHSNMTNNNNRKCELDLAIQMLTQIILDKQVQLEQLQCELASINDMESILTDVIKSTGVSMEELSPVEKVEKKVIDTVVPDNIRAIEEPISEHNPIEE
jgi:hypothetical protein